MTTNILTAIVTAYISTGHPCANGHYPKCSYTVAIPRSYPLGTKVQIDGKWYVGGDRTNKRFDGRFDIFVASKEEAILFGKQTKQVTIIYAR